MKVQWSGKSMAEKKFSAIIEGGEEVHLTLDLDGATIKSHTWTVIGSLNLLEKAKFLKQNFPKSISDLKAPNEKDASSLLLKELILRVKGEWSDTEDPEICHCRKISQRTIERAILLGANTIEKVRKRTSANTGCGACMPDVQQLLSKLR